MKELRHILLVLSFMLVGLSSCTDEEMPEFDMPDVPEIPSSPSTTRSSVASTSGLVKQADGTYTVTRRVPLVGSGRILDDYSNGALTVASGNINMNNITDLDLSNYAQIGGGVADAGVATNLIFSVRDIHHTYKAGTKVGVIFEATKNELLSLDLLKGFRLTTSITEPNGKDTHELESSKGDTSGGGSLLKLSLISIGGENGLREISFTTTQNFNEVGFFVDGVNLSALKDAGIKIYYAFVGDNEERPIINGSVDFPDASVDRRSSWTRLAFSERLVDSDLNNCCSFELFSGLFSQPCATVNYGRELPEGTEVGYVISNSDLLSLGTGSVLETYDGKDNKIDHIAEAKVLGLSLQAGERRRVSMITTKPSNKIYIAFPTVLKVGVTNVFYAYARWKVEVDPSSYFSMPPKVSAQGNSLVLPSPEQGKVTYAVAGSPDGAVPEIIKDEKSGVTRIKGMTKNGEYKLLASFTPPTDGGKEVKPVLTDCIIDRKVDEQTNCELISNSKYGALFDDNAEIVTNALGEGALLQIANNLISDGGNVIDDDINSFAKMYQVASVAENTVIFNIKLNQPIDPKTVSKTQKVRAGFIFQSNFNFLKVDALNTLRVVLINGEKKVADSGKDNGQQFNGLKVGLLDVKKDKLRIYVETDQPFDRIALLSSGLVKLNISQTRVYGAYWESTDKEVVGVEELGMELINTFQHNAHINYNGMNFAVVGVGATMMDWAKVIDQSSASYLKAGGLKVINGQQIAVKFNPIKGNNRVGVILGNPGGLDLALGTGTELILYNNGTKVKENTEKGGLLELKLSGPDGRSYIECEYNGEFDEIRYSYGDVAGLKVFKVYGAYVRRDNSDGGGVPDETEENQVPENPDKPIVPLVATLVEEHLCQNNDLHIQLNKPIPEGDNRYTVECTNLSTGEMMTFPNLALDEQNRITVSMTEVGKFMVQVYLATDKKTISNRMNSVVHPLRTTWNGNIGTDWDDWNNWSDGSPWKCTDVIIPRTHRYPILSQNGFNYCDNIHFAARTELQNSHLLRYFGLVSVDMGMPSGHAFLLSAPLKDMVTGDMFVPAKWNGNHSQEEVFTRLTSSTSPEERFVPRVYQNFWNSEVIGKLVADGGLVSEITYVASDWSAPFNAVAEHYLPGMGFKVRAEHPDRKIVAFRFPKLHREYSYFDGQGNLTGFSENVSREHAGKFIFDNRTDEEKFSNGNYTVTLKNHKPSKLFVAGNPYMIHIDIEKFLLVNKDVISAVKLYNSDGVATAQLSSDKLKVVFANEAYRYIEPMQGFYVEANTEEATLNLKYTSEMQVQKPNYSMMSLSSSYGLSRGNSLSRSGNTSFGQLRIEASVNGKGSSCLVICSDRSDNSYRASEDSQLLYDKEDAPAVAVFTVADGRALDVQQLSETSEIPLGLLVKEKSSVTLSVMKGRGNAWSGWALEDRKTGKRYTLESEDTYIDLGMIGNELKRYYLIKL